MFRSSIEWALVPIRLILGIGFVVHGYPKLFETHPGFVENLQGMGVPLPELMAWGVGILEFVGGLLLIAGALVPIISVLGIINMLVAMLLVHWPNGFKFSNSPPGVEVNLLYIAGFLALLIGGAGMLSVDRALATRRREAR